jgi:hypothetical protein
MRGVQGSGPLREGEVPPWHKRTTVRAEKRRLLTWMAEDDRHNRRENNDIKLAKNQKAHVPAIVLVECFTPSNIKDLFASIDTWPIRTKHRPQISVPCRGGFAGCGRDVEAANSVASC